MSFFDDSHVTDIGLQGSAGPTVGGFEFIAQKWQQQFKVDSARALDEELQNRWSASLRALDAAGGGRFELPGDPLSYRGYAQMVRGEPITTFPMTVRGNAAGARTPYEVQGAELVENERPEDMLKDMIAANEAIKKLNSPDVKSFEAILEEVGQMQAEVEGRTASMSERASLGVQILGLAGSVAGSFTGRDPLNIVTAPIGFGRTVATRIAVDMGVAALTTAATEYGDVQGNRALAGLSERDPVSDILFATLGAGVIRGGIEGVGKGLEVLRGRATPDIDFDLRDSQLSQMFSSIDTPRARAANSILDDTIVVERNNPYGTGPVATERFLVELRDMQRALNGEPMTAVARVLPPLPFEYVEKQADFMLVKEQAPLVYARMEAAQAKVTLANQRMNDYSVEISPNADLDWIGKSLGYPDPRNLDEFSQAANMKAARDGIPYDDLDRPGTSARKRFNEEDPVSAMDDAVIANDTGYGLPTNRKEARAQRRAATREYIAAYREVEAEAAKIKAAETSHRVLQQNNSLRTLGPDILSEPMTGPLTRHDFVEAHAARIDEAEAAQPARADAVNTLEVDLETNTVNIGTKTPVSVDFKVPLEDGEMSIRQILDDLAEDDALEQAMKGCTI